MVRDTARGHLSAYLSSPREAVMDHTLHLHLHLYAPCAAKHQMPLSLSNIGNIYGLWKKTELDEQNIK